MKNSSPFLSVIIPVFNETKRIVNLTFINDYFSRQKFTFELIVVNDGSQDNTLKKLKQLKKNLNCTIISYSQNQGKGYALRTGMLKATGKYRLFMDIDLSTPLEEFRKFRPWLEKYPVIIGTRKTKDSMLLVRQPPLRELLGKGFTVLSKYILGVKISDFTCGFKCFSTTAAQNIFSKLSINRWGFDSESLFLAKKLHYPIKEVIVVWKNDPQTKVKFPQDILTSLFDLMKIKFNETSGRYQ